MKKFIGHLIIFIFPALIFLLIAIMISAKIVENNFSSKIPGAEYLFLGHSQTECAVNDALIPKSKNLSQGGEAYFYTYPKLKKLLQDNPQIKVVFVSFSNNQIEKKMDDWAFDDIHLNQYFAKYGFLMGKEDFYLIAKYNPSYFFQANLAALEDNIKTIAKRKSLVEKQNWGGYLPIKHSKLDSLKKVNYIAHMKQNHTNAISENSIQNLEKMVRLCKNSGVQLIFVRTPFDKDLKKIYNENQFQEIRKKYFANIPFWDFRDTPISNDGFLDYDHLNKKGAEEFSLILNDKIKFSLKD